MSALTPITSSPVGLETEPYHKTPKEAWDLIEEGDHASILKILIFYQENHKKVIDTRDIFKITRYFLHLTEDIRKLIELTKKQVIKEEVLQQVVPILYGLLNQCHQYLSGLRRTVRDGFFIQRYFAGIDMLEPLECIENMLNLLNKWNENIITDDNLQMLIEILNSKYVSNNIQKIIVGILEAIGQKEPSKRKLIFGVFVPFLGHSPGRSSDNFIPFVKNALLTVVCSSDDFEQIKYILKQYVIPLLNNSAEKSFFANIFNKISNVDVKKKVMFFLLDLLRDFENSYDILRAISIAFANPLVSDLPITNLNPKEGEQLIHSLQVHIISLRIEEDFIEDYVNNLFKAINNISKQFSSDILGKEMYNIFSFGFFCIEKVENPIVVKYALYFMANYAKQTINIFHGLNESNISELIKALLKYLENEELEIQACNLLIYIKSLPSISSHIEKYKISLEPLEKYLRSPEKSVKEDPKESEAFESRKQSLKEKLNTILIEYEETEEEARFKFLKAKYIPFLKEIFEIISDKKVTEDSANSLYHSMTEEFISESYSNNPIFAFHLNFLFQLYTYCPKKFLKYMSMSNISHLLSRIHKNPELMSPMVIKILSMFKEQMGYIEIVEQIVDLFITIIKRKMNEKVPFNFNEDPIIKALYTLGKNSSLMVKQYILKKIEMCVENGVLNHYQLDIFIKELSDSAQENIIMKDAHSAFIKGDFQNAIKLYLSLLEGEKLEPSQVVTVHIELGIAYAANKEFGRAADIFQKAINLDPKDYKILFYYAKFKMESEGNYSEALKLFKKAQRLNDFYAPLFYHRAVCFENLARNNEAIKELESATFMRPRYIEYFERLVFLHYKTKNVEEARSTLEEIHNIDPGHTAVTRNRIHTAFSYANLVLPTSHPYFDEFNKVFDYFNQIPEDKLKKEHLAEIIERLRKFVPADILEDCALFFEADNISYCKHPNEKRRFIKDFLDYVLHNILLTEYHSGFHLLKDNINRETNIIRLLNESKLNAIFNEFDEITLYNKLKSSCHVLTIFELLRGYLTSNALKGGYALGITEDIASSYDIFPKLLGLFRWEATYGNFWIYDSRKHTEQFFEHILKSQKPIIFFVPTNIGNDTKESKDSVTYREVQWVAKAMSEGRDLSNVFLVFDSYNYLPFYILAQQEPVGSSSFMLVDSDQSFNIIVKFILNHIIDPRDHAKTTEAMRSNFATHTERHVEGEMVYELIRTVGYHSEEIGRNESWRQKFLDEMRGMLLSSFKQHNPKIIFEVLINKLKALEQGSKEDKTTLEQRIVLVKFISSLLSDPDYRTKLNPENGFNTDILEPIYRIVGSVCLANQLNQLFKPLFKLLVLYKGQISKESLTQLVTWSRQISEEERDNFFDFMSDDDSCIVGGLKILEKTILGETDFGNIHVAVETINIILRYTGIKGMELAVDALITRMIAIFEKTPQKFKENVAFQHASLFNTLVKIRLSRSQECNVTIIEHLTKLRMLPYDESSKEKIQIRLERTLNFIPIECYQAFFNIAPDNYKTILHRLSLKSSLPKKDDVLAIFDNFVREVSQGIASDSIKNIPENEEYARIIRALVNFPDLIKENMKHILKQFLICVSLEKFNDINTLFKNKSYNRFQNLLSKITMQLLIEILKEIKNDQNLAILPFLKHVEYCITEVQKKHADIPPAKDRAAGTLQADSTDKVKTLTFILETDIQDQGFKSQKSDEKIKGKAKELPRQRFI